MLLLDTHALVTESETMSRKRFPPLRDGLPG